MSDPRFIDTTEALEALVSELSGERLFGLDTEFLRERTYFPRLALVQLRWGEGSALVDPLVVDLRALRTLLESPALWVVHAATQDLEILGHAIGATPARLFDPQIAAGFLGYRTPSLDTLVRDLLGLELNKSDQLTDWTRRPLTETQKRYALADVEHLLELHRILEERLAARGRIEWVQEECERLRTRDVRRPAPEIAWWRIKGQKKLPRRAAKVAQALGAFREREAARLDVPTRFVLADMAILAMAHRPPTTDAQLRNVRGLEAGRMKPAQATAILAAVQEGLEMPTEALQMPPAREPREKVPAAIAALCLAWVMQRAADEELDPALLGTREEVETLAAGEVSGRLGTGFRFDIVGRDLRRILHGEVAVTAAADGKVRLVQAAPEKNLH
jgi:ribonuclease D